MPTVLREGPYAVSFYMSDLAEPPHVHVWRDRHVAKYWLGPVRLVRSGRFSPLELRRIERMLRANEFLLLEAWHGVPRP